ncbi:MAG: hypothetical protein D3M94_07290 [Rhodocyclales bacterium GT-UBC]|nr:MAG: hypothetical protein D3M94_07290 [Rhodocyclales bacterium GT-UBC]
MNNVINFPTLAPALEHLAPSLNVPTSRPLNDARTDIESLITDIRFAFNYAQEHALAVLSVNADRFGAYMIIAPTEHVKTLFGAECTCWRNYESEGTATEHWVASIEHIRVFWREVKCVH